MFDSVQNTLEIASTLYIEDEDISRDLGKSALDEENLRNVIAPETAQNCREIIKASHFSEALIDFRLTDWTGKENNFPITFGDTLCHNGVELAKYLLSQNADMRIGVFSSFAVDLQGILIRSGIFDKVQLVSLKDVPADNNYKYVADFVRYQALDIKIKPLFDRKIELPSLIKFFYARKILQTFSVGEKIWKAGNFAWLVEVKNSQTDQIKLVNTPAITKGEETYRVKVDRIKLSLIQFADTESMLSTDMLLKEISKDEFDLNQFLKNRPVYEIFIGRLIVKEYLNETISLKKAIQVLHHLGFLAKLDSQKEIFKEIQKKYPDRFKSKEEIYDALCEFYENGLPKIMDVYTGRVVSVEDGIAAITLDSYSPESPTMLEYFDLAFLNEYHLEESSKFEYTIYKPLIGGCAFYIDPI